MIVMDKGVVWKPVMSMRVFHISLVADVMLGAYKDLQLNIRSTLIKTLRQSVKTLGRERNLCVVITFII